MADQRLASPVHANEGKEPMLNLVQLACSRGEMIERDGESDLVRVILELDFPEADAKAVAFTHISRDHQGGGTWKGRRSHALPPTPDRLERKGLRS